MVPDQNFRYAPHIPVFVMAVYRQPVFSPISTFLPVRDREPTRLQLLVFVVLKPGSVWRAKIISGLLCGQLQQRTLRGIIHKIVFYCSQSWHRDR